ncbi:MAG: vitamin B12 dependent-methionine synthase activation domain-containing protein [Halomonas sp.]|uniref:vitamin B12 dependent-methionine synthase activation domain-containing protein n=1 Tax=Halomonas sp. TaxID=1486246 RepID=UPI002ACE6EFE|nr:vitamin B12 dependent-methionine synthase activation domain-containing protein [Halomonas sp.]MDZ7852634.1 vitamin B12 dependent-methionine synthase activation domain-containing protein [Halomonas sp.]
MRRPARSARPRAPIPSICPSETVRRRPISARLEHLRADGARVPRYQGLRELSHRRSSPVHRLGLLLRLLADEGRFPEILDDPELGTEARTLYEDAQALLRRIIDEKLLSAHGVLGFWPANATDDDNIELYTDDSRAEIRGVIQTLRQQKRKSETPVLPLAFRLRRPQGNRRGVTTWARFAVTAATGWTLCR